MEARERKIGLKRKLFKLFLNDEDDFIYINENDAGIFDRFAEFIAWIDKKSAEDEKKERELKEKYGEVFKTDKDGEIEDINTEAFLETSKYRIKTYQEAAEKIDAIFGQDVLRKYFRPLYEANPDFIPDDECIYDFVEEITPVLNDLFADRKKRIDFKYNKNRSGGRKTKYRK